MKSSQRDLERRKGKEEGSSPKVGEQQGKLDVSDTRVGFKGGIIWKFDKSVLSFFLIHFRSYSAHVLL